MKALITVCDSWLTPFVAALIAALALLLIAYVGNVWMETCERSRGMTNEQEQAATDKMVAVWRELAIAIITDPHENSFDRARTRNIVALCNRIDADAKRIAELERVTGPVMPCGCRAVAMMDSPSGVRCCKHKTEHCVSAEFIAWRNSR